LGGVQALVLKEHRGSREIRRCLVWHRRFASPGNLVDAAQGAKTVKMSVASSTQVDAEFAAE
jgi:hypothetical protein